MLGPEAWSLSALSLSHNGYGLAWLLLSVIVLVLVLLLVDDSLVESVC